jgi:hypothetical protein
MPTNRHKRVRRRATAKGDTDQLMHLQKGWCFFTAYPFDDDAHRRRVWLANRKVLMARQPGPGFDPVGSEREPGTKPRAWFDYEGTNNGKAQTD